MKVIEINSVPYGSTGEIMFSIGMLGKKRGDTFYYALPNGRHMKKKKWAMILFQLEGERLRIFI